MEKVLKTQAQNFDYQTHSRECKHKNEKNTQDKRMHSQKKRAAKGGKPAAKT